MKNRGTGRTDGGSGRISVKEASDLLGIPPYSVRYWMQTGQLKIGHYIRSASGKTGTYVIYRELVEKWKKGEVT